MAIRASVNVSITPALERFVQELVASGRYHSASEVFRDGLRLLELAERRRLLEKWLVEALTPAEQAKLPPDLLEEARSCIEAKIQEGLDALGRGGAVDGEEFLARWKARLDETARPRASSVQNRGDPEPCALILTYRLERGSRSVFLPEEQAL